MDTERLVQRVIEFQSALKRLHEALIAPETDLVRDAVIQRFEFTYELAWKVMKLWLESKNIDVRNPKDSLREALTQGLIDDGNGWSDLHEQRNLTVHTYNEEMAINVYTKLIERGPVLFDALDRRLQELLGRLLP